MIIDSVNNLKLSVEQINFISLLHNNNFDKIDKTYSRKFVKYMIDNLVDIGLLDLDKNKMTDNVLPTMCTGFTNIYSTILSRYNLSITDIRLLSTINDHPGLTGYRYHDLVFNENDNPSPSKIYTHIRYLKYLKLIDNNNMVIGGDNGIKLILTHCDSVSKLYSDINKIYLSKLRAYIHYHKA